ncbi:DNA polymerase [Bacillus velezensis]|uniref:DNA polymerase n=2 Tax=Bacillus velezensis TaxID=492670 RepID=UPI0003A9AE10|nr:DNA polymerase [Bacillus velezensis]AUS14822.1 DNA polymerase I [Bacillus velezensis]AUS17033.1 DNA polymerase I [Bacillus velezensis]MCM3276311.1 DNA polymerase [Bacillus velezensis]MCM3350139.1 DNA polymerase [Bacillus velezensis]MCV4329261.1 DNA polymerase [Bacillus velezensis]
MEGLRLNMNALKPAAPKSDAVEATAKRKAKAKTAEPIEESWRKIFAMKLSDADRKRVTEVKAAMDAGKLARDPADCVNKAGNPKAFSKAEALRLWKTLQEAQREETLRQMVENTPDNYWLITDVERFNEFLALLADEEEIVFDVETTGADTWEDRIVGNVISAVKSNIHAYIPTKHVTEAPQLPHAYVMEKLKPIYEDASVKKIAHNGKFDIHMLSHEGVTLRGLAWDTQFAMHILNENERVTGGSYRLKDLVTKYLGIPSQTYDELFGKAGFHEVADLRVALAYAAKDGDVTLKLRNFQREHLRKIGLLEYYEQVENPTISVSVEMEAAGFVLDIEKAKTLGAELKAELIDIEEGLRKHFGEINFNSPAQLSEKFFDELKLDRYLPKGFKKSTDVKTLKLLAPHHEGIKLLLSYREKTKLLGTYIEALPQQVKADGRIHGNFNQTGTVTGRFSSNNPNLQNQPYFARKLFVAPPGQVILSGDFSQQEPRFLSHFTGEEVLVNAYREGRDLYSTAASELFGLPIEECGDGSKYRKMMKTGILAVMYGTGPKTLADQLGITEKEAKDFIAQFYEKYPKVKAWIDGNEQFAKRYGYVQMFHGRKRRLPEAKSRDRFTQFRAMRQATNAIIQGSAAIQTKLTMIELQKLCRHKGWTMAFSVHDEVAVYAPETLTRDDVADFEAVMLNTLRLDVPNKTDIEISRRWGEGFPVDEWFKNKEAV